MSTVARGVHARTRPGRSAPRAQSGRHVGSVPSRSSPSVRAHRCARARVARVVRVRSVDEAEDVNAEADKDAEADERTFAPDVEAIAKGGLAKALPEVDARLTLAMRGESAGAQSDTDADALTAKRAASTAEDQAVDIVACLKQCRRPPRVRRRSARPPPRLRPLRAQTQRHRGGETPVAHREHHIGPPGPHK